MKLATCAIVTALALVFGASSAVADEQLATAKNVSQPTVMSDAELDQIVGGISVVNRLVNIWSDHDVWDAGNGKALIHLQHVLQVVPNGE